MLHPGIGNPKVREITPEVTVITKLVHFFAEIGVNAGIIQTPESVIFIDSGMSAYSGEFLWSLAEKRMNGSEKIYLILTHKDTDHCFGMNELVKRGAIVISHAHTAEHLEANGDLSIHPIATRILEEYANEEVLGEAIISIPQQTIANDIELDLGEEFQILVVPGHTPGDIAVYHPRSKTLFAGDAILEGMDPYIRNDSIELETWILHLERLKQLDIDWICPGHGELSKPDIIDTNIDFLKKCLRGD